jgi:acyl-CoA synthetase (AMP-forming)/AMP-acid ligase II
MRTLLHELVTSAALHNPDATALVHRDQKTSYAELDEVTRSAAAGLVAQGLARRERVAIYLPKQLETVVGMCATTRAGGSFVPVNPVLKAPQVAHIVQDCTASGCRPLASSSVMAKSSFTSR